MSNVSQEDLVLCESPDGWSLHAPGCTDEQIATGDAPYLLTGPSEEGPSRADYDEAWSIYLRRIVPEPEGGFPGHDEDA